MNAAHTRESYVPQAMNAALDNQAAAFVVLGVILLVALGYAAVEVAWLCRRRADYERRITEALDLCKPEVRP